MATMIPETPDPARQRALQGFATQARSRLGKPVAIFNRVSGPMPDSGLFRLPPDGWYPFVTLGEFPGELILPDDTKEDIIQVIDEQAIEAMLANWPEDGELLIDYEHFSHDSEKATVAAGWLRGLQKRPDGLYSSNAWSARGRADVTGGNYRFISPEFEDLEDLGEGRYRPRLIVGAGLTNRPALKTLKPLSNRAGNTNTNTKTMDYKAMLIQLLGLDAEATDDAINQAFAAKGTTANADPARADGADPAAIQAENEQLKKDNDAMREELAESDLDKHKGVITNRDTVKKALLADRAGTLDLLKGIKPSTPEAPAVPPTVYNRNTAKAPAAPVSEEEIDAASEKRAARVQNRARELQDQDKTLTLSQAYARAEGEIE